MLLRRSVLVGTGIGAVHRVASHAVHRHRARSRAVVHRTGVQRRHFHGRQNEPHSKECGQAPEPQVVLPVT